MARVIVLRKRAWTPSPADDADRLPANDAAPVISGTPEPGEVLTCSTGTWQRAVLTRYTYQWELDGTPIAGAESSSYTVQVGDVGSDLTCVVTARNVIGAATAESDPVTVVAP
jgi:hypothetical protein